MLTPEDIDRLLSFDGGDAWVLSAYLDLDAARRIKRSYLIAFEDLTRAKREQLAEPARDHFAREVTNARAWLEGQEPSGKGLALISCSPKSFWQAHVLAVRVREHLAFERRPDVAPLLELVDEYERYAVALVDKKEARLFSVFLGEIEESKAFKDPLVPTKHDEGGLSQANFQRHHETHVHWLLKRAARSLTELHRRRRFDRLILAGPDEATTALRRLLPRPLARLLVAVAPIQADAGDAEILNATLEVERRIEREAEDRLLKELLDFAGPGGRASLGVVPTLDALWADMVQTLVVADGAHAGGSECINCGRLELGTVATCPACGKTMATLHDVFHRAMARAREQAAGVEVVHGAAARLLKETGGGLGAFVRYRWGAAG
jgi:peptide subunit release factor 1 (eRF1)